MIIKKFQGKTEEEAVASAKKELGDALVIMNVRNVKKKGLFGFLYGPQKEVTVALEEEAALQAQNQSAAVRQDDGLRAAVAAVSQIAKQQIEEEEKKPAAEKEKKQGAKEAGEKDRQEKSEKEKGEKEKSTEVIEEKLDYLEDLLKKQIVSPEEKDEERDTPKTAKKDADDSNVAFYKLLYQFMLEHEIDERYVNQLIDDLDRSMKPNMPVDYMLSIIYQRMVLKFGQPSTITPAQKGPKFVFFVGPTGVGKTTTIAKIASRLCVDEKKKIALLTADTYRIAAAEQLKTYANILEVPFQVVYTAPEVESAFREYHDCDYVLVDTAGHSHQNAEQRNAMGAFVHALDGKVEKEVYLVLSATTKYRDLLSIADTYQEMTDYKLIFTKLDETTTLGNLLNLRLHTGAEMSYVTCGQNVPDDIEQFDAQQTVKKLLAGKRA